jgi:uncharacterized MAPEG superfamily protein
MTNLVNYETTIFVIWLIGLMQLVQLLGADISAIRACKTPGFSTGPDHSSFLFRAERAFMNTNESATIFLLFASFLVISSANPNRLNSLSVTYGLSRFLHMLLYYFDMKIARSAVFAVSLLALAGMFVVGVVEWL